MDDNNIPKTRKGKNGLKKDQRMKAQNDSIFGSKKHVRLKEKMMESVSLTNMNKDKDKGNGKGKGKDKGTNK
jgi:hypothetical protein